ncbi:MAG TPA: c-type cytochrome domain-containing protein [Verrucomicrobiae bacterium]
MNPPPEFMVFLGRLHVVLVHVPIAVIALLALLEWLPRYPRLRHANANAGIILTVSIPVALLTVACGWLLSLSGDYDAGLLRWHKWTGITTVSLFVGAGLLYWLDLKKPYRFCVFSSVAVLALASHLGGSLTHGRDYLVRYAPGPLRHWLAPSAASGPAPAGPVAPGETQVFSGLVQPILQRNCVPCHGPEKTKAGLRLDSFERLLKGGEDGPAIVPGKSAESLALKRVQLPTSSEDHMPPEGKHQPSADEIALLRWWVDAGAPTNKNVLELKPPPGILRIVEAQLGASSPATVTATLPSPVPRNQVLPLASKLADELGVVIAPLSQTEPWLECNASVAGTNFGDAQLSQLAPLRANLRWLDLGGTATTDRGLSEIARLPNLTRLHLERTAVTDDGLGALASLSQLEYLNLYGTVISDSGLEHLQQLPRLKQLYAWQTKISAEAATNFAQARIDSTQIARWQEEIARLKAKIQDAHFLLDIGGTTAPPSDTNANSSTNAPSAAASPANSTKTR